MASSTKIPSKPVKSPVHLCDTPGCFYHCLITEVVTPEETFLRYTENFQGRVPVLEMLNFKPQAPQHFVLHVLKLRNLAPRHNRRFRRNPYGLLYAPPFSHRPCNLRKLYSCVHL